ncbi:hypothetical protein IAD21_06443 (plasmid) [Abditibacteriota bacterium]|nr:hypothetical protein IAD21_06443 [Abditibacteriota bacterium]
MKNFLTSQAQRVADAFKVTTFGEIRPLTFLGKGPNGVPVQWWLNEAGETVSLVVGAGIHTCAVWRAGDGWECAPTEPFNDIMARGLRALGCADESRFQSLKEPVSDNE